MGTHNICVDEDLTKISFNYHRISLNTQLISSSAYKAIINYDMSLLVPDVPLKSYDTVLQNKIHIVQVYESV